MKSWVRLIKKDFLNGEIKMRNKTKKKMVSQN
jgi:hypothetical protein